MPALDLSLRLGMIRRPTRISVSSSLLTATMNQKSSLREDLQFVSWVLTGNRRDQPSRPVERAILIHCRFSPCYDFLMKDMQAQLDKLRADALIRDLATDPTKRDLFTKLAEHYSVLANEVARAIEAQTSKIPKE